MAARNDWPPATDVAPATAGPERIGGALKRERDMHSAYYSVIAVILLLPWTILAVTIIGNIHAWWVRKTRPAVKNSHQPPIGQTSSQAASGTPGTSLENPPPRLLAGSSM